MRMGDYTQANTTCLSIFIPSGYIFSVLINHKMNSYIKSGLLACHYYNICVDDTLDGT